MSYGPPTATTITGLPVPSNALTRSCWVVSAHALDVVTTVTSAARAAATACAITAGPGDPVHNRCAVRPRAVRPLVRFWVVPTPQPVTSTFGPGASGSPPPLRSNVIDRRAVAAMVWRCSGVPTEELIRAGVV